ncbi:hypothetical protein [Mesorhizobium sp. NZP2077]|uniref:hypothetical protein n=1 Tax=Mesorhizobium sp. NZP2077 TaxID=2483404 RepID=UPI001556C12A|nr:hypothetical protein [Mesorhizobium sp. NZP2077]QKD16300.1 hypothetical protein HGP13_15140 [Mesorhizobium sp. NZP2077]
MSSDLNPRPINGCIKFGNLNNYTPAQFMGSAADEAENAHSNGCAGLAPSGGDTIEGAFLTDGWSDNVRVFFPSDPDNPHDTMLELTGTIGLTNVGEGNYESFFKYRAARYKDRPDGQPGDVTVTPVFPYDREKFFSAYYNTNKEAARLGSDGNITFKVDALSAIWRPVPAYYEFRDRQNRVLGAIPMPLLGTAGAN